jgi:hypothetical protein
LFITKGETLLYLNDEKDIEPTIDWVKAMWTRWERLSVASQQSIYNVFQKGNWKRGFEGLTDEQRRWVQGEEIPSMMKKEKKEPAKSQKS